MYPPFSNTKSGVIKVVCDYGLHHITKKRAFVAFPNKGYKTVAIRGSTQPDFHAVMVKVDRSEVHVFLIGQKYCLAHGKVHIAATYAFQ